MKGLRSPWIVLLIAGLILSGCSAPKPTTTPDPNAVATQVKKFLTSIPAQTVLPSPVATEAPTQEVAPTTAATPTTIMLPTKTALPTASPTPAGTAMAASTATPAAGDPRATLGEPTRKDNLDTAQYWGPYEDDHVRVSGKTGYLEMVAKSADGWHGWTLSYPKVTNFYVEETAKPGSCAGADAYGLMVRSPNANQGYFFEISCDGKYKFQRWDGSTFFVLKEWTENSAILKGPDQTNRLGVKAEGAKFTLYVNGVQVGEASDSTYASGVFGLFISSTNTADFTVQVDEVDYWALQ